MTYAEGQVSAETHAGGTDLASAVRTADQVVNHQCRILIVCSQLLLNLVQIALI